MLVQQAADGRNRCGSCANWRCHLAMLCHSPSFLPLPFASLPSPPSYFFDTANVKNGGNRWATVLMYLTDVEEGGETGAGRVLLACMCCACATQLL